MLPLRRYAPGLVGCAVLFAIISIQYLVVAGAVPVFVYPLDDSYIHMALARTLASDHGWGIGPYAFASASSSIGWTCVLAVFDRLLGDHVLTPLFLNAAFGGALLLLIDGMLRQARLFLRWIAQALAITLIPLPCIVFMGMEHTAHAFFSVLVVALAIVILAVPKEEEVERFPAVVLVLATLVVGSLRYEAVFLIVPVVILLWVRGRWELAVATGFAGALVPIAFGLYSHHQVGLWLPFSVMMKRYLTSSISHNPFVAFFAHTHRSARMIAPLGGLLWLIGMERGRFWKRSQLGLMLFTIVAFAHLSTAPVGWMFRYEAYLYALMIFAFAMAFADPDYRACVAYAQLEPVRRPVTAISALLALLLLIPLAPVFAPRLAGGITLPPLASEDRYAEHYQIAEFIHEYYDHATIMADDIGMLAYYTHAQVLDIIGLGSGARPLALHAGKPFAAPQVFAWGRQMGAEIAPLELGDGSPALTPPEWIKAETWIIPRNVIYGDLQIDFFATSPAGLSGLCEGLRQFSLRYGVTRAPQPACAMSR